MFKNLGLATKLISGFLAVISFTFICGVFGIAKLSTMNGILDDVFDNHLESIVDLANANMQAIYHNRGSYRYIIATDRADMDQIKKQVDAQESKMREFLDKYRQTELSSEEKELLPKLDEAWREYMAAINKMFPLSYENKNKEAMDVMTQEARPRFQAADDLLTKLVDINQGLAREAKDEAAGIYRAARSLLIGLVTGATLIGTALALLITRGISRPINRIIEGLGEGARQVNEAASQVAQAAQTLAEGASEQASSLEETSSALEEMAAMTRTNAGNAKQANELSEQARKAADDGDRTIVKLNSSMASINESSEKISKIIKVIEEIAFQTNLLALNAAVEAARAGEHGKGFAVVADEVRNLAQRAAQAARETTDLIETAVNNARQGTQVSGEVGKALSAIVGDVEKVSGLIGGISKASEEQAQGVDQVNTAVAQMDKVTQQNSSAAEESASASEELAAQAVAVNNMIGELVTLVRGARNAPVTAHAVGPARRGSAGSAVLKLKTSKRPAAQEPADDLATF